MRATFIDIVALAFFSTILAVVSGCDDSLDFANTPPGGLTISRDKCYLGPDDTVILGGQATDADGDSISYSWTAESGTLSPADGKGQVVTWQAPDGHGTYRVTLKASDGLEVTSKGVDIDVGRNLDVLHDGGVLDQTDYAYIVPNVLPLFIGLITVTIEAGVTVVFNEGTGGFNVIGTLVINGTEQGRVLLKPNVCPGEDRVWKGIKFSGDQAAGTMSCVTMTSTADGLAIEDGAIVTADNIIVDQTSGDAISVESGGNLTLTNSRIWDNGAGIYVANGMLQISNSTIRWNGSYGFSMIQSGGTFGVAVDSCVVANNVQNGFVLAGSASPAVHNCSLFWNGPSTTNIRTVWFHDNYSNTDPVDMTSNFWGVNTVLEIPPQITRGGANGIVDYSGWLEEPPVQD